MTQRFQPTEEGGYEALRAHVQERAQMALERHGPDFDEGSLRRMLADTDVVRFPTRLHFDATDLLPGEFGWARPRGERPTDGFDLTIHPHFEGRWDVLPLLVGYHIVSINYLDIATHEEAEIFGSTLLQLEREKYYDAICALADSIPGAPRHDPELAERFYGATESGASSGAALPAAASPAPSCGSGNGGGACGCHGGASQ